MYSRDSGSMDRVLIFLLLHGCPVSMVINVIPQFPCPNHVQIHTHQHHIMCVSAFPLAQSKILPNFEGFLQSSNQWIGFRKTYMVLPWSYPFCTIYMGVTRCHLWDPRNPRRRRFVANAQIGAVPDRACATAWLSTTTFSRAKAL